MKIIEKIRKQSNESNSILLNYTKLTANLKFELEVSFFINLKELKVAYIDVPIKNIVSLGRNDHWNNETPTWNELINNWIVGLNWTDEVIDYFENEIGDKNFPALGAGGNLRLESYGGLITCANGNHRIVGAVCWLTSKYGDNAVLKNVRVTNFPFKNIFYEFLDKLSENDEIYLFQHNNEKKYIRIMNKLNNYIKYYEITNNDELLSLGSIKVKYSCFKIINEYFLDKVLIKKNLKQYSFFEWKPINKQYFEIMKKV